MNSAHDVGGMHGFGAVVREENEPVFHAEWEKGIFAVANANLFQGLYTLDAYRHSIERMGNVDYLDTGYYEHWLAGVAMLLVERGVLEEGELEARIEAVRANPERYTLPPAEGPDELSGLIEGAVKFGASTHREIEAAPLFAVGDEVVTARRSPKGHTRLPRYARGRRGRVLLGHGAHVLPDANAHDLGECPEHLYTVSFDPAELWGDSADGRGWVNIDLWESYLSPVDKESA